MPKAVMMAALILMQQVNQELPSSAMKCVIYSAMKYVTPPRS